jgi:putative flavoprotein involved in K+ transport
MLDEADEYVARNGLDLPEEPQARTFGPDPECVVDPLSELDLASAGVTSIVWATGFVSDYGWLQVDAFDDNGKPQHTRGVSAEPGIYLAYHDAHQEAHHDAHPTVTTTGAA